MVAALIKPGRLDRIAIGLSGLCVAHCLATTILLAIVVSVGGFLGSPVFHEAGLILAMVLGIIALGRGALEHKFLLPVGVGALGLATMAMALTLPEAGAEPLFTVVGVSILALAHRLNFLAAE